MSFATRCTSCGTVFRVVQDQLKVSDGWVRCGRCDAVFNAAEGLFDVDRDSPPSWSPTQPPAPPPAPRFAIPPHNGFDTDEPEVRPDDRDDAVFEEAPAGLGTIEADRPAFSVTEDLHGPTFESPADQSGPDSRLEPLGFAAEPRFDPAGEPAEAPSSASEGWHPHGDARRRGRRSSIAWAAAAVLLAVLLFAQGAAQFSEITVARWPGARPALAGWCSVAGCSVAAPRRIQELVVDSSALAPVTGTEALKLDIAIRNRANFAVATPAVDLSLTDSAGQLIARRTLRPSDFQAAAPTLAPGSEQTLRALLTAGAATVTGYTVEIYYP